MKFIIATTALLTGLAALPNGLSYYADPNSLISPAPNVQEPPIAPGPNSQQPPIAPGPNAEQQTTPIDPSKQSGEGKTDKFWGGYYPWGGYYSWGGYYPWNGYYPYGYYGSYGPYGPYWRSNVANGADSAESKANNNPTA